MKQTKIISIANHKGGVGKTTTTVNVGAILASKGKKVLLVDLDAQANLTSCIYHGDTEENIYTALTEKSELPVIGIKEGLWLVPASLQLAMADIELASAIAREKLLSNLLNNVAGDYDCVIIDCPPSLGLLTLNAFTASTDIIIPLVAEVLPFQGLAMINDFIRMVRARLNPDAHISGVLITRWENTNLGKSVERQLRESLGAKVFETKIRKNVSLAEAPYEVKDIVEYAPKSNGAADYEDFTKELCDKLGI